MINLIRIATRGFRGKWRAAGCVRGVEGRAGCIDPGSTDLFTTFAALGQQTRARSHLALDTVLSPAMALPSRCNYTPSFCSSLVQLNIVREREWPRHRQSFVLESTTKQNESTVHINELCERHYFVMNKRNLQLVNMENKRNVTKTKYSD